MNPLSLDSSPSSSSFDLFVKKQHHGVFSEQPTKHAKSQFQTNGNKLSLYKHQQPPSNFNTQLKKRKLSEMKSHPPFPSNTSDIQPNNAISHVSNNYNTNTNTNTHSINPYEQSKQTENKLKFQNSLKVLDKILYEDEHLIISDSILAPSLPSYAPIEKQTATTNANTYAIKIK